MTRRVGSADGTRIAVYETGDPDAPTIVAVHGYPDNHTVWDALVTELCERYRVVTYDVRGAGQSEWPAERSAYRMEHLVDDLVAVLDDVAPDRPVHLLGHDWGSIQCWPALVDDRIQGRVRSFTSISGPSLDHATQWLRGAAHRPAKVLRQLADSYYILLFQLPVLPEVLARRGAIDIGIRRLAVRARTDTGIVDSTWRTKADALNGIELYRANMLTHLGRSRPQRITIPVQVLAPSDDPHVTVALQTEAPRPFVDDLRIEVVDGGHWIVAQRPELIAARVEAFISAVG
jgi:pimeloyl-ACP methyl ester carboxylesterase